MVPSGGASVVIVLVGCLGEPMSRFRCVPIGALVLATGCAIGPPAPLHAPRAPRWALELPSELPKQTAALLRERSAERLAADDHRGALEDTFRILVADPAAPHIRGRTVAAGTGFVLDAISPANAPPEGREHWRRVADRQRLIAAWRTGGALARERSAKILTEQHGDDPVVIELLGLTGTEARDAAAAAAARGHAALAEGRYDEASTALAEAFPATEAPEARAEIRGALRRAQTEVARASREGWLEAIGFEIAGDRAAATARFRALRTAHPSNPSAHWHLDRLR